MGIMKTVFCSQLYPTAPPRFCQFLRGRARLASRLVCRASLVSINPSLILESLLSALEGSALLFLCFSFFPSPYFLSFCCCCCVYPNIKKVYIYIWQPDLICLFSASSGSQLKCKLTIIQIKPIIPF